MKTTLTLITFGLFLQTFGQQQTAIFFDAASASGVQQMFYKTSIAEIHQTMYLHAVQQ